MKKTELLKIAFLMLLPLLLFYPLRSATYAYTDEWVRLWLYRKGAGFMMFLPQGRYITEYLFQWLFSAIHTVEEIRFIRMFSLLGWVVCIPVWFVVLKNVVEKEGLSRALAFLAVVYLIASPPFSISVQ